jgi:hypothetical protein
MSNPVMTYVFRSPFNRFSKLAPLLFLGGLGVRDDGACVGLLELGCPGFLLGGGEVKSCQARVFPGLLYV